MHAVRLSGSRKGEKAVDVVIVGGLERRDVAGAGLGGFDQIGAAPAKSFPPEADRQKVRRHASVSPVAVGERVDGDESVMKPHRDFVR